jgi:Protein of unknown function (DUF3016)
MRAASLTLAIALSTAQVAAAATAEVEFVNPAKFTDAGTPTRYIDRNEVLGNLKKHFIGQAAHLPADQKLFISVTDVDLAGAYEPWQLYSREVRIVKEIYPPKIDFKFRLFAADGTVVKEGERSLRDTGFMSGPSFGYGGDNLRYEKVMLDTWFEKEFGKPAR